MLTITEGADAALTHVRSNIEGLTEDAGLRIHVDPEDDGESFTLEIVAAPESDDVIIEGHPMRVFIAADAADELADAALDGSSHGDHVHFGIVDLSQSADDPASS